MYDQQFNTDIDYHQVVLFEKAGEYGILALTRNKDRFMVLGRSCRYTVNHSPQTEGFAAAKLSFERSVQTSVEEGWRVAWRGFPQGRPRTFCVPCRKRWGERAVYCGSCGGKLDR